MRMTRNLLATNLILSFACGTFSALANSQDIKQQGQVNKMSDIRHDLTLYCHSKENLFAQLNLTQAQKDKLKLLNSKSNALSKEQRAALHQQRVANNQILQAQIQALLTAPSFDENQAQMIATGLYQPQIDIRAQVLKRQFDKISVLTPEQKTKYFELLNQMRTDCKNFAKRYNEQIKQNK